jgi:hypothetical protein
MKKRNLKNSIIALTIGLAMVSCGGGNSSKQQSADGKIDAAEVVKEAEIQNSFSEAAAEAAMPAKKGVHKNFFYQNPVVCRLVASRRAAFFIIFNQQHYASHF